MVCWPIPWLKALTSECLQVVPAGSAHTCPALLFSAASLQKPDSAWRVYICLQDDPDMEEEITPAVVACGSEYTASITRRGQLLTWGLGSRGELGHELPNAGEVGAISLAHARAWHR
jgi:hypothetical protein